MEQRIVLQLSVEEVNGSNSIGSLSTKEHLNGEGIILYADTIY